MMLRGKSKWSDTLKAINGCFHLAVYACLEVEETYRHIHLGLLAACTVITQISISNILPIVPKVHSSLPSHPSIHPLSCPTKDIWQLTKIDK